MSLFGGHESDFNSLCKWKCCMEQKHMKINRKYFWACLNEIKQGDDSSRFDKQQLIYENSIDLNVDKSVRSVLCIGLDPKNKFQVAARIQLHNTGQFLILNSNELKGMLESVESERINILDAVQMRKSATARHKVKISSVEPQKYAVVAHNHTIHLDIASLQRLCALREYIQ